MSKSRSILVLGIPRSGTSCVAGVLHKLGINMGVGHFQPKDKFNPRGYFEDLRWRHVNQRVTGTGYSTLGLDLSGISKEQRLSYKRLAEECQQQPLWGIKDPFLCFVGQYIWRYLTDTRMIVVYRDFDASVASVARQIKKTYRGRYKLTARQIQQRWRRGMDRRLEEFKGPVYHLRYERLVRESCKEILALAKFCYEGLDIQPTGNIDKITKWVTPKLKHF